MKSERGDRPRTTLLQIQQQDVVVVLPLKDKLLILSRRFTAKHARQKDNIEQRDLQGVIFKVVGDVLCAHQFISIELGAHSKRQASI